MQSPVANGWTPFKVLESQEKEKKQKHLGACLENRRHFTPLVLSVDGLLGQDAQAFAECLAVKLAGKWQKPCSQAAGCVKARLSTAAVRATCVCLRGSRVPTAHNVSTQFSQREDGAGLAMHEWTVMFCPRFWQVAPPLVPHRERDCVDEIDGQTDDKREQAREIIDRGWKPCG
jgi:hypothetical protein